MQLKSVIVLMELMLGRIRVSLSEGSHGYGVIPLPLPLSLSLSPSLSYTHTHTKLLAALVVLAGLGIIVTRACRQFKVHDVKEQSPTMWPYPPGGLFSNHLWCNLCSLLRKFSFWILWKIQSCIHH